MVVKFHVEVDPHTITVKRKFLFFTWSKIEFCETSRFYDWLVKEVRYGKKDTTKTQK